MSKFASIEEIKLGKAVNVTSRDYANYLINLLDTKQVDKIYMYDKLYWSIWRSKYAVFYTD